MADGKENPEKHIQQKSGVDCAGADAEPRSSGMRSSRFLPPIGNGKRPDTPIPFKSSVEDKSRTSSNSGGLGKPSTYLDWSAVRTDEKPYTQYTGQIPKREKAQSMSSFKEAEDQEIIDYLEKNKDFLESYVTHHVPIEVIEKWLFAKMKNSYRNPSTSTSSEKQYAKLKQSEKFCKKEIFTNLLKVLKDDPNQHSVVLELARYIVASVGVDAYRVYKLYPDHPSFVQYFVTDSDHENQQAPSENLARTEPDQVGLVLEVAKSGACCRLSKAEEPLRFPKMPEFLQKTMKVKNAKEARYVMYQPILTKAGKTAYVIEMWRVKDKFREQDEEASSNFLVLGSLVLHYCNLYLDKKRERNMSDFLLDVVKAIFEEMVSLDQLIKRILEFAQRLVNADRASLFLVDYRNFELVSTVFDLKFEPGHDRDMEKKEIRMPINRGIAGHVALSGETMNIPDAYSDYRFNREVDEATGYKTVSILCMPIKVEGRVIGVVQMVNKRNDDNFGHEDEVAFEIFSTFFGLALHNARLYDRIMRKEQKYRVALEVLSYHNTCKENEVQKMLSDKEPIAVDLNDFYLDPFLFDPFQKCKCVIEMFKDLFDLTNFDISTLTRFILTVKKNYRTVPYHNFDHGWSVAHAMYVILKSDRRKRFSYKVDGHNIFSHITSEDYKEILGLIRHCILATDLAAFFPNLERINDLHREGTRPQFSWNVHSHRDLAMAISMTAADLSASTKPWDIQIKTVKVIFEEFYEQGDKEREAGRVPIPMMDRNKPDEQPASQVGFLSQICIPCYKVLHKILPTTKPMYTMALKNLDRWKYRAARILRKLENTNEEIHDDNSDVHLEDICEEKEIEDEVEGTDDEDDVHKVRVEVINQESGVMIDVKRDSITWEDEEVEKHEICTSGIWNNIDGVAWMDEEGVVINKKAFNAIVNRESNDKN